MIWIICTWWGCGQIVNFSLHLVSNVLQLSQGSITGITRWNNSRLQHFLIAPVVSTIYQEMYDMGNASIGSGKNEKCWERLIQIGRTKNKRVSSMLEVLTRHNFSLCPEENVMKNIVTDQVKISKWEENIRMIWMC